MHSPAQNVAEFLQLSYCSQSRLAGRPEQIEREIQQILRVSREQNEADQITGALLYNGRAFAQVLEGPAEAVDRCFARILEDARHTSVVQVGRERISRRLFSNWSMAYVGASTLRTLPDAGTELETVLSNGRSRPGFILNLLRDLVAATQEFA